MGCQVFRDEGASLTEEMLFRKYLLEQWEDHRQIKIPFIELLFSFSHMGQILKSNRTRKDQWPSIAVKIVTLHLPFPFMRDREKSMIEDEKF